MAALPHAAPVQAPVGGGDPLALIVPVYNEAENFPALVAEVERHVPPPYRLYMVYDFDEDTTVPVARSLAPSRPWLRMVKNDLGRGVVWALKAGFQAVKRGPALVVMADLSDDLSIVPAMLALYRRGFQVVCPSRYMRGGRQVGGPLLKRFLSRAAGLSLHYLAGLPIHDATNNFRLYDAALVNELGIASTGGFELALELTAKAFRRGVRIAEVPTTWRDRTAGESRFRLSKWLPKYLYWYGHVFQTRAARPGGRAKC
jgi:glycosyltransferase involved in cell wall biosynthesis